MKTFKQERFLTKNFRGHTSLTNSNCYLLKNDCDEKKKKTLTKDSPFPVLNALLVPFLKERRVIFRAHGKHKFITSYFRSIFVIGLDYCKFLRVHVAHANIVEPQALQVVPL